MAYYRQSYTSFFPPLTRMVKALVIVTSAAFLLTYVPAVIFPSFTFPGEWLALHPGDVVRHGFIWQLVTYLFLHGGFFHIIFNMFALWMFGSDLESLWGSRRFLQFYFLTGIGAGLFEVIVRTIFPPAVPIATLGCSGAIMGLLLAFGMTWPDRPIMLYFIIPIKAKWFVAIIGLIEVVSALGPPSGISNVAHIGGLLTAFLYLRSGGLPYELQGRLQSWRRARLRRRFEVYMRKQEKKDDKGRWIN